MPYDITGTMEKAVGALRVLQTFWSNNESEEHGHQGSAQASSTLQASPATETPTRRLWHQKVKLEEEEEEPPSSENNWTQASEIRDHIDRSTRGSANLTNQHIDSTLRRASTSLGSPQEEYPGPSNPRRPDVPYTNAGFVMPPETEASHVTSNSPQSSTHDSNDDMENSIVALNGNSSQPSAGPSRERQDSLRDYGAPRIDRRVYSDEEVHNQPDIIFADGSLTMSLDGPHLREIIHRIEQDRLLCFKMRWYVARHVRRQYQTDLTPSTQLYRRRVNRNHNFTRQPNRAEQLISLRDKPFNRLDFEATRLQENFQKDQSGWQVRSITQILQRAYEQYRWDETVTDENVDSVLVLQAGADLRIFDAAGRISRPHHGTPLNMPAHEVLRVIEAESFPKASSSSLMRVAASPGQNNPADQATQRTPQGPGISPQNTSIDTASNDEIILLRAEISELKAEVERGRQFRENFVEEQKASQEALMAEMRMMLEAAECGKKRKRSSDKKQFSRRKSKKLRKYVRKLKELDAQTDGSLSSSSSMAEILSSDSE